MKQMHSSKILHPLNENDLLQIIVYSIKWDYAEKAPEGYPGHSKYSGLQLQRYFPKSRKLEQSV
jgi:hypothetical protein